MRVRPGWATQLEISNLRAAADAACDCSSFDGSSPDKKHGKYVKCAKDVVSAQVLAGNLRKQCKGFVLRTYAQSSCGFATTPKGDKIPCVKKVLKSGKVSCAVKPVDTCIGKAGKYTRTPCPLIASCLDAGDTNGNLVLDAGDTGACSIVSLRTVDIPSGAEPPHTPGSTGVTVTDHGLLTQFGGPDFSLNNARYTRFRFSRVSGPPDAILILSPGFEGGAASFKILAENLLQRALDDHGLSIEVWAYDRRTNQLEDRSGLSVAAAQSDAQVALDWLFGPQLGIVGPLPRNAVFHGIFAETAFMAEWTNLVFSRDIDAIVSAADAVVKNHNVFLGGHSAGTGFAARYAATDFNLSGVGDPDPGYAKLRGLVLLEGGGGSTSGAALTPDTLDRIIAKYDGGIYGAVRDNAGRCVDGVTACTIANEATACVGQVPPKCTLPTTSYSTGLINPQILATAEPLAIQAFTDPDGGQAILQVDQDGITGNNAVAQVPELGSLSLVIPAATAEGSLGKFLDDDSDVAGIAPFVATSLGAPGPTVNGLLTWQDITEGPLPASVLPNNGPAPTSLPGGIWGQEKEDTRFDRLRSTFSLPNTNFTDWYYPVAGPSTTSVSGQCSGLSGTCTVGNVGAACSGATQAGADAKCNQSISLDSSALSIGRGRPDIENLTQAAEIDIPVIAFGCTNGLTPVPGDYVPFASSIATCTAPSCDGTTPRIVSASSPNPAFPTFGNVSGGFEVYMTEGFSHVDVVTAEDGPDNNIIGPLSDFLARNIEP